MKNAKTNQRRRKPNALISVSVPAARSILIPPRQARIRNDGRTTTITHREYVGEVSAGLVANIFDMRLSEWVTPNNSALFRWLSAIGDQFEEYRFTKCDLQFVASAGPTAGRLMMAFDPDAADADPVDKSEFLALANSASGPLYMYATKPLTLRIPPQALNGPQQWRLTPAPGFGSSDPYKNAGAVYVAIANSPTTSTTYGELWIDYTIQLRIPHLNTEASLSEDIVDLNGTTVAAIFTGALLGTTNHGSVMRLVPSDLTKVAVKGGSWAFTLFIAGGTIADLSMGLYGSATSTASTNLVVAADGKSARLSGAITSTGSDFFATPTLGASFSSLSSAITYLGFTLTAATMASGYLHLWKTASTTVTALGKFNTPVDHLDLESRSRSESFELEMPTLSTQDRKERMRK